MVCLFSHLNLKYQDILVSHILPEELMGTSILEFYSGAEMHF